MALWQVKFEMLPKDLLAGCDELPDDVFAQYFDDPDGPSPQFALPVNYAEQVAAILPPMPSWSSELQIWGIGASDDVQIWKDHGAISSIGVRVDVRKLDDQLLLKLLTLTEQWGCLLVEMRYRKVCRFGVNELRGLIAGHPHSRAMRDPATWLPVLAEEVKRQEGST